MSDPFEEWVTENLGAQIRYRLQVEPAVVARYVGVFQGDPVARQWLAAAGAPAGPAGTDRPADASAEPAGTGRSADEDDDAVPAFEPLKVSPEVDGVDSDVVAADPAFADIDPDRRAALLAAALEQLMQPTGVDEPVAYPHQG